MYFRKNLIVIKENIKDKTIENKCKIEKLISPEEITFFKPKKVTAPNVGIENKKEIFTASVLLKFNILAAVMVMPDLLTPGNKDNT